MMMRRKGFWSLTGFTLSELLLAAAILAFVLTGLLLLFINCSLLNEANRNLTIATSYAQELMEVIESKRFDENTVPPWTASANLGVDLDESRANKGTFDDVDDFMTSGANSCTDPWVTTPATGYSRSVVVDYVTLNVTTWQTSIDPTDYKRIIVSVNWKDRNGRERHIDLETLITK